MAEWHHVSMRVHATSPVARVSGAGQWVPLSDFPGFGNKTGDDQYVATSRVFERDCWI
jgi:hypothetical protein